MILTKHKTANGSRWAVNGYFLPMGLTLSALLTMQGEAMMQMLEHASKAEAATGELEAPLDSHHEVWAAGVTYLRSRDARKEESAVADMYQKIYDAVRPEIFSKSMGWRVSGTEGSIRIRRDSHWNVPEPELVLVINSRNEIVGYCAGNDVSSRDIEGENPLYLPQAKVYNGSCALGHAIVLCKPEKIKDIPIRLEIVRAGSVIFDGHANTTTMKRTLPELVNFLTRELDFPQGVFLMTGTCLVPDGFTLQIDDVVTVQVGAAKIMNRVGI